MRPMAPSAGDEPRSVGRAVAWVEYVALAVIAFVPQLLTQPGVVSSDTKTYLYINLPTYLRQSVSMWDPTIGMGTVNHQQVGFLWPMGPFFLAVHALHIPLWAGQRLWVGALLFSAGAGILYLCRTVRLDGPGRIVAASVFMLSPYFLEYVGRLSVLLLPWAGLGWLMAFVIQAVRTPNWRYPALFALVWLTISGTNASGPIYVVVAPILWLPYVVLVTKERTWRQVWRPAWRIAVLSGAVSLWWLVALLEEGRYGLQLLAYTEQVSHVAATSLSSEVLRGLGYWYYYGVDSYGQWADTSIGLTQSLLVVALTLAVPFLALAAAVIVRWRRRAFFALLVVVGMVLAVGTHPYAAPSVIGAELRKIMTHSTVGAALRSTDRATPIVMLGLGMLLGAGITALTRRARLAGVLCAVVVMAMVAGANPAVWNGSTVNDRYTQPSPLPSYARAAAKALNAERVGTRVLAIPGQNFAAYRYGDTTDPIWPGLLTRPFVTREQFPLGSLAGYDLLLGLDNPMQIGTSNPAAIAPLARLMSVGDVLVQNDLAYELYNQPQPQQFWKSLDVPSPGLDAPIGFGTPRPNLPRVPDVSALTLAAAPDSTWPAPVEVMAVKSPRPLVRGEPTSAAVVVAGDGDGLNAAAGLGLLNTTAPVLYSGAIDKHPKALAAAMAGGATLVETDTNRKQLFLWSRIQGNAGLTLTASQSQPKYPLDIFPGAPRDAQSVADIEGVKTVAGAPESPTHAPVMAIDGNPDTSWQTVSGINVRNKWWETSFDRPVTTDHITISQPVVGGYNYDQWITRATLQFNGGPAVSVSLDPSSRTAGGQTISFGTRTFGTLRVTITGTNLTGSPLKVRDAAAPVGLAEVSVPGIQAQQVLAMPGDLLASTHTASQGHRLVVVMTRQRDPAATDTPQSDPDPTLARAFTLPTSRTFALSGTARISSLATDPTVDTLVGRPGVTAGAVTASSSGRLPGDLRATASSALDGDPATMWSPNLGTGAQAGSSISIDLAHPVSFDHMDLQVVADGNHSVPTAMRITTENGSSSVVLPAITDQHRDDATVSVPVSFPTVTGSHVTVTFTRVRLEQTISDTIKEPVALPLGIAELGIPGVRVAAAAPTLATTCRSDLLTLDGHPLWTELVGSTQTALAGQGIAVRPCGPDAAGVRLAAGRHVVQSAPGQSTGFQVDQLVLDSAPGGGALPSASLTTVPTPTASAVSAPTVRVVSQSATAMRVKVTHANRPFWLVLGESINAGWKATVDNGHQLGASTLVDGFGNGWIVNPGGRATLSVTMVWTPQGSVDIALVVSMAAALGCVVLAVWTGRRRRTGRARHGRGVLAMSAPGNAEVGTGDLSSAEQGTQTEEPSTPALANPFDSDTSRPSWPAIVAGVVVAALICAAVVPPATLLPAPLVGLGVGAVVLLSLVVARMRSLLAAGVVGFTVAAVLYTVLAQATHHFPAPGWPSHFERANVLVWAALAFLVGDVVVEVVRARRR